MSALEARTADRDGRVEDAARLYDEAIRSGEQSPETLVDALLLYWQTGEAGFAVGYKLSAEFMAWAGDRFEVLFALARKLYPSNIEIEFWWRYIRFVDLGEPLSFEECEELFMRDRSTLAPVLFLFSDSAGARYQREALELLGRSQEKGTAGARYVASVIEGWLISNYHHLPPFPELHE